MPCDLVKPESAAPQADLKTLKLDVDTFGTKFDVVRALLSAHLQLAQAEMWKFAQYVAQLLYDLGKQIIGIPCVPKPVMSRLHRICSNCTTLDPHEPRAAIAGTLLEPSSPPVRLQVLIDPPWEEYARRAPGAPGLDDVWAWQDIQALDIAAIADTPSFVFLWCARRPRCHLLVCLIWPGRWQETQGQHGPELSDSAGPARTYPSLDHGPVLPLILARNVDAFQTVCSAQGRRYVGATQITTAPLRVAPTVRSCAVLSHAAIETQTACMRLRTSHGTAAHRGCPRHEHRACLLTVSLVRVTNSDCPQVRQCGGA